MQEFQVNSSPSMGEDEGGGKEKIKNIARQLRKRPTETENYLWKYLRNKQIEGFKFRRQQPIGSYIVDFVNFNKKLVIEIDGGQHQVNKSKDLVRDNWLRKKGFKVLRFWDNEVFNNVEGVLEIIREFLLTPYLNPLPQGERK